MCYKYITSIFNIFLMFFTMKIKRKREKSKKKKKSKIYPIEMDNTLHIIFKLYRLDIAKEKNSGGLKT